MKGQTKRAQHSNLRRQHLATQGVALLVLCLLFLRKALKHVPALKQLPVDRQLVNATAVLDYTQSFKSRDDPLLNSSTCHPKSSPHCMRGPGANAASVANSSCRHVEGRFSQHLQISVSNVVRRLGLSWLAGAKLHLCMSLLWLEFILPANSLAFRFRLPHSHTPGKAHCPTAHGCHCQHFTGI